jgi:hypothetical protein
VRRDRAGAAHSAADYVRRPIRPSHPGSNDLRRRISDLPTYAPRARWSHETAQIRSVNERLALKSSIHNRSYGLWLRYIPCAMLRDFTTAWAPRDFPLKVACGATPRGQERVPGVTAFAGPAKANRRLEEALRTTNKPAVGTAHSGAVQTFAPCRLRRHDPPETPGVRWVRLHLGNRRSRHTSTACSQFDGCEEVSPRKKASVELAMPRIAQPFADRRFAPHIPGPQPIKAGEQGAAHKSASRWAGISYQTPYPVLRPISSPPSGKRILDSI